MSGAPMLKKLLEAENSSRCLLEEAEEAAAKRVREALYVLQEEFQNSRDRRLREIAIEEKKYFHELEDWQKSRMTAFEEELKNVELSTSAAGLELRKIIGLL